MARVAHVEIHEGPQVKCFVPPDLALHVRDDCIVEENRTLDFGRVMRLVEHTGDPREVGSLPRVIRQATLQDQAKAKENALRSKMAQDSCAASAERHGLEMQLVRVRFSFDRSLLTVVFLAEKRLDFREMVKDLTGELKSRVEMKQIGVRDNAAIAGGLGPCGRALCCCTWLEHFESINVKMAKTQGLSLNPNSISGMCGRLKCCLRYEFATYRECDKQVPRDGATVTTPSGTGTVVGRDILGQKVRVRFDDNRVHEYAAADVDVTRVRYPRPQRPPAPAPAADERKEETP